MRTALIALCMSLAACAPQRPPAAATARAFDPLAFFAGRTRGHGELELLARGDRTVSVEGRGRLLPDGTLVLRQRIEEERRPARTRQWRLRRVGLRTYEGTLTDATGPVRGRVDGGRLHLSYPIRGGLDVDQWVDLAPDGRSARNRLVVNKLGVPLATLNETIRKLD